MNPHTAPTHKIEWARKAVKQLNKVHTTSRVPLYEAVQTLAYMPDVHNVVALNNHDYGYRLRVGNYRVLFDWASTIRIVSIQEVKKRDERTY